ncbi:MAG: hypothetical protein WC998_00230 [Candidatus Paceibacterota bacterium]|jgi:hypothetical protein
MEELLLDKEQIRTMKKDMREAEGVMVYPAEKEQTINLSLDIGDSIEKSSPNLDIKKSKAEKNNQKQEKLPPDNELMIIKDKVNLAIEKSPKNIDPAVEQEKLKAENLARELALLSNESKDIIKEQVLQEGSGKSPIIEKIATEETYQEPAPKPDLIIPEPAPEVIEPKEPLVEEPAPKPDLIIPEPAPEVIEPKKPQEELPSALELGLEDPEEKEIPMAKDLELEEKTEKPAIEKEVEVVDENEAKLERIAEQSLELEEKMRKIKDENAPFEKRKKEIEEEISNIKKKLDLVLERKIKIDEIKKTIEEKEALAKTPEEKRAIEKERWRTEDDRNSIEKEKDEKEDEIKSLRLQLRECDLNAEKITAAEKEIAQDLEILKRDRDKIILGQTKQDLEKRLKPLEDEIENIKRGMFENTKMKDKLDKTLNDVQLKEKSTEEEIKLLEKRQNETKDEVILRDIETRRRNIEENRRQMEKERWDIEDRTADLEEKRKIIKKNYQEVASQARQIKADLVEIEEKLK